jgi:hypothetical protein
MAVPQPPPAAVEPRRPQLSAAYAHIGEDCRCRVERFAAVEDRARSQNACEETRIACGEQDAAHEQRQQRQVLGLYRKRPGGILLGRCGAVRAGALSIQRLERSRSHSRRLWDLNRARALGGAEILVSGCVVVATKGSIRRCVG